MADLSQVDDSVDEVAETEELLEEEHDRLYLCSACGHPITSSAERITANGSFGHTFTNPAGYIYRIGVFRSAQGSRIVGDYMREFSWFKGHAWCYVVCAECLVHLGWHFSGTSGRDFFGLILEKLVESEAGR